MPACDTVNHCQSWDLTQPSDVWKSVCATSQRPHGKSAESALHPGFRMNYGAEAGTLCRQPTDTEGKAVTPTVLNLSSVVS